MLETESGGAVNKDKVLIIDCNQNRKCLGDPPPTTLQNLQQTIDVIQNFLVRIVTCMFFFNAQYTHRLQLE